MISLFYVYNYGDATISRAQTCILIIPTTHICTQQRIEIYDETWR